MAQLWWFEPAKPPIPMFSPTGELWDTVAKLQELGRSSFHDALLWSFLIGSNQLILCYWWKPSV